MTKRTLFLTLLSIPVLVMGCDPGGGGIPEIIGSVATTAVKPAADVLTYIGTPEHKRREKTIPAEWYPPRHLEKPWKAIIIHHSVTTTGNAAAFDSYHKQKGWKGIGYDFVIGNGGGTTDGQVEVTSRWKEQIPGAHVGGTPGNWANKDGIGICLVGDFRKTQPTYVQMQSLVKLIKFLQKRYKITESRIYGHRETPGYTGGTVCPANFPMATLKRLL